MKVTKLEKDSTVSKIIDMVQNATETKAKSEKFISKFSKTWVFVEIFSSIISPQHTHLFGYMEKIIWFNK